MFIRADSKALLELCGIRDLGATSFSCACPACKAADALVVRGTDDLTCRACGFIGDAVEMYAKVTSKSMQLSVSELLMEGVISFDEEKGEERYLDFRARNQVALQLFRSTSKVLRGTVPSSINVLLVEFKCQFTPQTINKLAAHMGCLRAEDVPEELIDKHNRGALRAIGRYSTICLPVWNDSVLMGFYLLHSTQLDNGYIYMPIVRGTGYAYAKTVELHDHCFIAQDPVVALRLMSRQMYDLNRYVTPVLVPGYYRDLASNEDERHAVSVRHPIFLPCPTAGPGYTDWYARAARLAGSETVQDWKLGFTIRSGWPKPFSGPTIGIEEILRWIRSQAVDSHRAIGALLLSKSIGDASRLVMSFTLTGTDRMRILSFFEGAELAQLAELLKTEKTVESIRFDGDLIEETTAGWVKGKVLISDAVIRFTEMRTDATTGDSVLGGIVTIRGKAIPFKENYDVLKRGTATWLDRLVRLNGEWAQINARWGTKLLAIAHAFSSNMIMNANARPAGWTARTCLTFPNFTVDADGVHRASNAVGGPEIPYPVPPSATDLDSFASQAFCQVFMALMGNLARTAADYPGIGIAVKAAPHLPERIAAALGVQFHRDASPEEVAANAKAPLPLFGTWSPSALAAVLRMKGAKHVFASVDEKTFDLLGTEPGWLRLTVDSLASYEALRAVWYMLPHLIGKDGVGSRSFYRDSAQRIIDKADIPRSFLNSAGGALDTALVDENNMGTNMLVVLRQQSDGGRLVVTAVPEGYRIERAAIDKAFSSASFPGSNFRKVSYFLTEAKMLVAATDDHIVVNRDSWNLVASLVL